ncbi:MAG: HAMP domain-containing sensor histidine kinase [Thermodesulfobacteriota bacterium]
MSDAPINPVVLKSPVRKEKTWVYPWIGVVLGMAVGILVGHPLAMLAYNFHECMISGTTCNVTGALFHSFAFHMWPMMLLFSVFGGVSWGIIGFILKRLRDNRLRLDTLHQEFELQVATLRHHYKNLAIGIHGFSSRIRRRLTGLDEKFHICVRDNCANYDEIHKEFEVLARSAEILEEAAQRLTQVLGQELLFLKALASDSLTREPRNIYPFLVHCVQDLLGLRFREKEVRVEINGQPLDKCRESLVFAFEPYTLEVILQNILANAMKFGDHLRLRVSSEENWVRVKVQDNGPGVDLEKLKLNLMTPADRQEAESTHLGLRVSLHLLEKCGGRLSAWSPPEGGAAFVVEIPK